MVGGRKWRERGDPGLWSWGRWRQGGNGGNAGSIIMKSNYFSINGLIESKGGGKGNGGSGTKGGWWEVVMAKMVTQEAMGHQSKLKSM